MGGGAGTSDSRDSEAASRAWASATHSRSKPYASLYSWSVALPSMGRHFWYTRYTLAAATTWYRLQVLGSTTDAASAACCLLTCSSAASGECFRKSIASLPF